MKFQLLSQVSSTFYNVVIIDPLQSHHDNSSTTHMYTNFEQIDVCAVEWHILYSIVTGLKNCHVCTSRVEWPVYTQLQFKILKKPINS